MQDQTESQHPEGESPDSPRAATEVLQDGPPAVLLATKDQLPGAVMRIGGLTLVARAMRQLIATGYSQVVVVDDGSIPMPPIPPQGVVVEWVSTPQELAELRATLGDTPVFAADMVRPRDGDPEFSVHVTDEPSRLRAENAVMREIRRGDGGLAERMLFKRVSIVLTQKVLAQTTFGPKPLIYARMGVALLAGALLTTGSYVAGVIAMGFWGLHAILDCMDNEVARLRFEWRPAERHLDRLATQGAELLLFLSLAVGAANRADSGRIMSLGLFAFFLVLAYHVVALREEWQSHRQANPSTTGHPLDNFLSSPPIDIAWWHSTPKARREMQDRWAVGNRGPVDYLIGLGRMDGIIVVWTVMAVFGLYRLMVLYAVLLGLARASIALGQFVMGPRHDAE